MNKSELVAAIAEKAEMSKKDAEKALKAFEEVVTETLVAFDISLPTLSSTFTIHSRIYFSQKILLFTLA